MNITTDNFNSGDNQLTPVIFVGEQPYMDINGVLTPAVYGGAEGDNTVDSGNTTDQDLAKVQTFIKGQVETYFNELAQQHSAVQQRAQQLPSQQDQARQQVKELIDPFVQPGIDAAQLSAADAQDYVRFYTGSDDNTKEYRDKVEEMFTALAKAGRPTKREDIYHYLIGKEASQEPEKFVERLSAKRKAQLDRAEQATDFGSAALNKAKSDSTFTNFESKSLEDMEKALDGVTF